MSTQNDRARQTDAEAIANRHVIGFQLAHFFQQSLGRQDNTVADEAIDVLPQNAGRNQVKRCFLAVNYQGMTGIVPALEADNRCNLVGQQVNNLTLAFITPLGAQHNNIFTHDSLSMRLPRRTGVSQVYL